jgi:hypothetical protein
MSTPEGRVKEILLKAVKKLRGYCFKSAFVAQKGCPDWLVLFPEQGRFGYFELKSANGVLSPFQIKIIDLMRKSGMPVYVTSDEESIRDALEEILQSCS